MLSTSCNRALFMGIAVDSLKAHSRAWEQYMACESRPNSPKREKIRECALKHAIVALPLVATSKMNNSQAGLLASAQRIWLKTHQENCLSASILSSGSVFIDAVSGIPSGQKSAS